MGGFNHCRFHIDTVEPVAIGANEAHPCQQSLTVTGNDTPMWCGCRKNRMLGESNSVEIIGHTWEDADEAVEDADFVALPCGSIEQHSIHLPLSVDTLRADALTRELAKAAPDYELSIVVLPTLPYGYSEHHMSYPGTITLAADTYQEVIVDIGESVARHGALRFLLVNYHGGNREPLKLAADRLQRDTAIPTHIVNWTDYVRDELEERFGEGWGHAGDHETSAIEYFHSDLVRDDKKEPQVRVGEFDTRKYAYFDELTEQGGLGDPTNSNPEVFADVIPIANDRIIQALKDDINTDNSQI